jgi:hypothetical protein
MKFICVASPYAGDVKKNIAFAKQACRYVMEQGHAFFAPHLLYPQLLDDANPQERQSGIDMGLAILSRCDELWVCGDRISPGMAQEIEQAKTLGIPIQYVSAEQILNGLKPVYAIWAEARLDSPLAGRAGFLCQNRTRLRFSSRLETEVRINDIHNLCLNNAPAANYECVEYPAEHASDRNMNLETLRELDMTPDFDPDKFEIISQEYGNTGGQCMVATVEFYLPDLEKSVWVNCNDESVVITSADYTWNRDGSESWERYEDVCLYSSFFQQELPEDAEPWLPIISKALEYTIEQETAYFKDRTFSLPVAWLPESIRQKAAPEYLAWLQTESKELQIAQEGRIVIEKAYSQNNQNVTGMTGLQ